MVVNFTTEARNGEILFRKQELITKFIVGKKNTRNFYHDQIQPLRCHHISSTEHCGFTLTNLSCRSATVCKGGEYYFPGADFDFFAFADGEEEVRSRNQEKKTSEIQVVVVCKN